MADPDADLRTLFASAFVAGQPTDECPEPEVLFDAFHKLLPPDKVMAVIDHVTACPVCADAWRLASRTDRSPPERR